MSICPSGAITLHENHEGFLVPEINAEKCTNCDMCLDTCPLVTDVHKLRFDAPTVYAAWSKDKPIRTDSSSGGIFTVFADYILNQSGVVFGAAFDSDFKLRHHAVKNLADLHKLRGAKYLQSFIGDAYAKVANYLDGGLPVMFSGTPCQVAGLYGYLQKDYDNLLTCDLVCHGVPSQRFFDEYLQFLGQEGYNKFDDIRFRDKKTWKRATILTVHSTPEKEYLLNGRHDYYQQAFLKGLVSRRSCYSCKYAHIPRIGDVTLGDFWGIGEDIPFHHDITQGVSVLLVNSSRGETALQACKKDLFLEERQLSEAKKKNHRLYETSVYPPDRDTFLMDMPLMSIEALCSKYELSAKINMFQKLARTILQAIGPNGVAFLKRYFKKTKHD